MASNHLTPILYQKFFKLSSLIVVMCLGVATQNVPPQNPCDDLKYQMQQSEDEDQFFHRLLLLN